MTEFEADNFNARVKLAEDLGRAKGIISNLLDLIDGTLPETLSLEIQRAKEFIAKA